MRYYSTEVVTKDVIEWLVVMRGVSGLYQRAQAEVIANVWGVIYAAEMMAVICAAVVVIATGDICAMVLAEVILTYQVTRRVPSTNHFRGRETLMDLT